VKFSTLVDGVDKAMLYTSQLHTIHTALQINRIY